MTAPVRLGAVEYLNARPHVYGLSACDRFTLRFDLPVRCAQLLHEGTIDVGLVPSIEYLRGDEPYAMVPDVAVASRGPVVSVALFTTRPMTDVTSIVMDTSSRTSVALVRVLCARLFRITPTIRSHDPDLAAMLEQGDAALVIGDNALLCDYRSLRTDLEKIDLGEAWTTLTGLPFVWALWVGRPGALRAGDVDVLQQARDAGVQHVDEIARAAFPDASERQAIASAYLRDNIKYYLCADERAGLETFYRYAVEAGVVPASSPLRFF